VENRAGVVIAGEHSGERNAPLYYDANMIHSSDTMGTEPERQKEFPAEPLQALRCGSPWYLKQFEISADLPEGYFDNEKAPMRMSISKMNTDIFR
jgi:hypothetical protein